MATETTQKDTETKVEAVPAEVTPTTPAPATPKAPVTENKPREFTKNRRQPSRRRERPKSEFDQRILGIRRVTRVSSGGRRFSFSVTIVIGDHKGKIGVGLGKAGDTALAIEKAVKDAKRNMITIRTTPGMSIPHIVEAKYSSAMVKIMPAPGRGIIAGSALRDIIELAGLKDINGKIISGSKNKLNISKAVIKAFESLEEPKVAKKSKEEEVKK